MEITKHCDIDCNPIQVERVSVTSDKLLSDCGNFVRYIAVTRPVEYHMATVSSGPGKRVALYMVPTVVFSVLFNIPKFFELEANWHAVEDIERGRNITVVHFETTSLRKDPNYSFYYVHLTQLIVKGILPFGALVFLNLGIYR